MARPLPLRTPFAYARDSAFGYACGACGQCCYGKVIPLNPYEVARIANVLGTSTTDVRERFAGEGGASLSPRSDGRCVFLGDAGCEVHAGRPLACRLYPLGRHRAADGSERFAEVEPHPKSLGVYGPRGLDATVDDYLRAQGAGPYLQASDRYLALLERMIRVLAEQSDVERVAGDMRQEGALDTELLDVDAVVARWCAERDRAVPDDVEERVALHIAIVEATLERWNHS